MKAAPPLKVLDVYYLVFAFLKSLRSQCIAVPCCLEHIWSLVVLTVWLGAGRQATKVNKPKPLREQTSNWSCAVLSGSTWQWRLGSFHQRVLLLCSWADGRVLPAIFRESANSIQLPTTVCFVFVFVWGTPLMAFPLKPATDQSTWNIPPCPWAKKSQESSIWRWMTEFGQCPLLDPAVFLFLTVIKHRYSYHWFTWDTDGNSKEDMRL